MSVISLKTYSMLSLVLRFFSDVDDEWICSHCANKAVDKDRIKEYAITLTWLGLMDLVHKDTIREGNGPAMISVWKANMLRFWARRHNKYLILGHALIGGN